MSKATINVPMEAVSIQFKVCCGAMILFLGINDKEFKLSCVRSVFHLTCVFFIHIFSIDHYLLSNSLRFVNLKIAHFLQFKNK